MLLFMDSFDHYGSSQLGLKYTTHVGSEINVGSGSARFGTAGLEYRASNVTNTPYIHINFGGTASTIILGFAFRYISATTHDTALITFRESGTRHIELRLNNARRFYVTRNGTILGTSSTILSTSIWYYVELKIFINNSTGTITFKLDEINEITLTSQDTQNGGTGFINEILIGNPNDTITGSQSFDFDDLVILDTSGSTNNDFLGDVRVAAVFPNNNGTTSNFVGSDSNSTDNYLLVDEITPNGDTDYVQSNIIGDKDTYNVEDVSFTTGDVRGVQINMYARKTDAGGRSIASVARLSSTEVDSSNNALSNSYKYYRDIREEKPGGGVWTATDINDAEFGAKVTA